MNMYTNKSLLESISDKVRSGAKINEILTEKGLNWTVVQKDLEDSVVEIPNTVINYRSDNHAFLGLVSDSHYNVVNNEEAFEFIDYLNDFTIETAGEMKGGKEVFVVGKLNQPYQIVDNDYIDQYISFIHGHNGKRAIQIIISPIRMFCTNQLNLMFYKATFKYSVRHSGDVKLKLSYVQKALNAGNTYMVSLIDKFQHLIDCKPIISIQAFTNLLFPDNDNMTDRMSRRNEEIKNIIIDLYNNKEDNQNYKNTKFGYLNAVSDYLSHRNFKSYSADTKKSAFFSMAQNNTILDKAYTILKD